MRDLPSVSLKSRNRLPRSPGIYYAVCNGRVLYIGKSTNLYLRWNQKGDRAHHKLPALTRYQEVRIHYKLVPRWRLQHEEAIAIERFNPPLNFRQESKVWWVAIVDYAIPLAVGGLIAWCFHLAHPPQSESPKNHPLRSHGDREALNVFK